MSGSGVRCAFGLRTFVAGLPGSEALRPLHETGAAVRVRDAEELAAALRAGAAPATPPEQLWAPAARAAFEAFVRDALSAAP